MLHDRWWKKMEFVKWWYCHTQLNSILPCILLLLLLPMCHITCIITMLCFPTHLTQCTLRFLGQESCHHSSFTSIHHHTCFKNKVRAQVMFKYTRRPFTQCIQIETAEFCQ